MPKAGHDRPVGKRTSAHRQFCCLEARQEKHRTTTTHSASMESGSISRERDHGDVAPTRILCSPEKKVVATASSLKNRSERGAALSKSRNLRGNLPNLGQ